MPHSQVPELEMLWETSEPAEVLADRFGFADAVAAGRWVASVLDERWGIRVDSCERVVMSDANALAWVTTPSGPLIVKWCVAPPRFARLARVAQLTRWLDGQGLPVAAPVPSLQGHVQLELDGVSIGVHPVVQGVLLDVEDLTQVRAAGTVLARLHAALAAYPASEYFAADEPPRPLAERVSGWLDSPAAHLPRAGLEALRATLADTPDDPLPVQLLHGDFRSSNVLCSGSGVAAVIDFEEADVDHRIDELARSAVMLGTQFRRWGPVSEEVRAAFLAGYASERALSPAEARWWDVLVLWYSLALVPAGDDPTGWGAAALDLLAGQLPEKSDSYPSRSASQP